MNIRCSFCQTPYTLGRVALLDALQEVDANNLTHYDAHCPRCRRATPIPRPRLEMAMPDWKDQLKQFEREMKQHPQHEAPLPQPATAAVAEAAPAPEPAPVASTSKAAAKPAIKAKTATKSTGQGSSKPGARRTTPSAATKPGTKKPAPKGSSKKSK